MPTPLHYLEIDESWRERLAREWGGVVERHLHFSDGFSLLALCGEDPAGLISVYWRELPLPLSGVHEGYIDIIEVRPEFRRRGIARALVDISIQRAQAHHAFQLRAWSSEDKTEAIPMWQHLGFGLCPAITHPRGQEVRGYFVTKVLPPPV